MIKPNNRAFARGKIGQPRSARGNAFPLWWLSPPPFPRLRGKSGEAGKGEASAASQSAELFFMPYDIESQSRNADFISIARRAIHNPQRRSRCRPLSEAIHNPPPTGGHNLRPGGPSTFPFTTLRRNLRRQPRPFFIKLAAKPPPQPSA